jgi:hypothetical protein
MSTGTGPRPAERDERPSEARQLREAVGGLADKLDIAQQQTRLLRRLTLGVVALAIIAVVTGAIFAALLFQQLAKTNAFLEEGTASRGSIALIRDCIDPKGSCAKRQQANTAKVIGQIVDANHNGIPDSKEILDAIKALKNK